MDSLNGLSLSEELSPWAARFKQDDDYALFSVDGVMHSGMAPFPRLDPLHYDDEPAAEHFQYPQHGPDLDHILLSEAYQRFRLKGLTTWQLGTMNKYLYFGDRYGLLPGGHTSEAKLKSQNGHFSRHLIEDVNTAGGTKTTEDACNLIVKNEMITINENNWFPFLRRNRWYTAGIVNIDDEKSWEVLSLGLELANRMLQAMILDQHEWLQTILYGRLDHWSTFDPTVNPNKLVLLSLQKERQVATQLNIPVLGEYMTDIDPQDWKVRIEDLMSDQLWYIIDSGIREDALAIHHSDGIGLIGLGSNSVLCKYFRQHGCGRVF
ncbi:hypothetical protein F5Y18DRAFT_428367 [Xylariaceae sp. FL1019]|nr:hypothetical protein F5Y18DRAFT_428367 [Xylariaceae sp. FL1019]